MGRSANDEAALDVARRDLITYGQRMIADRLAVGTAGNLSVRVGDVVAISPSSIGYHELTPEDICTVSLEGEQVGGRAAVSSEWPMHSAIYHATDALAIVHTHSPEVIALSASRPELPAIHSLEGKDEPSGKQKRGHDWLVMDTPAGGDTFT